jgi:hypothetical protein
METTGVPRRANLGATEWRPTVGQTRPNMAKKIFLDLGKSTYSVCFRFNEFYPSFAN